MQTELDPQVVNLAKAIRQTESGGNFQAKGKSGEHGGYQYTPDTWNAVAPKYGITSKLEEATPEQQNAVTYNRIKEWKDKGHDVTQIASMWNAGEAEPNAYTGKFGVDTKTHKAGDPSTGVNSYGAKYDVPAYVKSVATAYQTLKDGGEVAPDTSNPSSVGNEPKFPPQMESQDVPPQPEQIPTEPAKPGFVQSAIQGIASPFLRIGSSVRSVAQEAGSIGAQLTGHQGLADRLDKAAHSEDDFGYLGKSKPLGQEGNAVSDLKDAVGVGVEGGLEMGTIEGGVGILKNLFGGTKLLPDVAKALGGPKVVAQMSKREIFDALSDELKNGDLPASTKEIIAQTIAKVRPAALREAGSGPSLASKVVSGAGKLAWKGLKGGLKATGIAELARGGQDIKSMLGLK